MKYHENISVFYQKLPTYNPQFQKYAESVRKRYKQGEKPNRQSQIKKSTNKLQNGLNLDSETPFDFNRGKYPESVQYFKSVPTSQGHRIHPSQKPTELLEYLIKTYSNEGDTVLDFTMGSGSTGIACINTNRKFIGIEKDPQYYKIAKNRLKEHTTQKTLI